MPSFECPNPIELDRQILGSVSRESLCQLHSFALDLLDRWDILTQHGEARFLRARTESRESGITLLEALRKTGGASCHVLESHLLGQISDRLRILHTLDNSHLQLLELQNSGATLLGKDYPSHTSALSILSRDLLDYADRSNQGWIIKLESSFDTGEAVLRVPTWAYFLTERDGIASYATTDPLPSSRPVQVLGRGITREVHRALEWLADRKAPSAPSGEPAEAVLEWQESRSLIWFRGRQIPLSPPESEILAFLAEAYPGCALLKSSKTKGRSFPNSGRTLKQITEKLGEPIHKAERWHGTRLLYPIVTRK